MYSNPMNPMNSKPVSTCRGILLRGIILIVATVLLAGCNIDGLWSPRADRDAPMVDQRGPAGHRRALGNRHPVEPIDLRIVDAQEVDLVEEVVANRNRYHQSLTRLRDYYRDHGEATKLGWAEFELNGAHGVKPFRYLVDAEVPSDALRPVHHIPEADKLYEQGVDLMRRGGHGVPALFREDLMIRAAGTFRRLITQFPSSDKIDDAAFFEGEIHKEYLPGTETIAVKWYERAWTWDANTPHPARFQAAVVYDYRLHDRDRALELYQQVVDRETDIQSNVRFAMRRVYELSSDRTASADVH